MNVCTICRGTRLRASGPWSYNYKDAPDAPDRDAVVIRFGDNHYVVSKEWGDSNGQKQGVEAEVKKVAIGTMTPSSYPSVDADAEIQEIQGVFTPAKPKS